jgi:hypothetical protein
MVVIRSYAFFSGPLFGAPASVQQRGFGFLSCIDARPLFPCGAVFGAPTSFGSSEGWPTTSIPSLEERLDDHQPT